jgi:hypothetical protein
MPTNLYFNNVTSNTEQDLINDLTSEVIQIHGMDVFYIPRILVKEDLLLGEDVLAKFGSTGRVYEIEMYLKTTEGFGGEGDLVSKFGLDIRDEVVFTVHKDRFELATDMEKPNEGDLIFLPISKGLFEVKFVEHEQPFYQAGKNYSFDVTCELFQYSEEQLETGITDIDNIEREQSAAIDFVLNAGGSDTFSIDEKIYQGPSLANATAQGSVVSWTAATRTLRANDTSGTFVAGQNITGDKSGAVWALTSYDDQELPTTPFADNKEFETEADSILDFSESNPFGEVT